MPTYFNASAVDSECVECGSALASCSLRCSKCGQGVHLVCSGLSRLSMVRLAITRASFDCGSCIRTRAGEKLEEVLREIDQLVELEKTNSNSTSASGDSQASDTSTVLSPERTAPSAPSASQLPPTQELGEVAQSRDDETWASVGLEESGSTGRNVRSAVQREGGPAPCSGSMDRPARQLSRRSRGGGSPSRGKQTSATRKRDSLQEEGRRVCKYYKMGNCKFGQKGDECKFDHPRKCYKFMRFGVAEGRGCKNKKCIYFHPPLCRATEEGRLCKSVNCKYFHRRDAKVKQRKLESANRRLTKVPKSTRVSYVERTDLENQSQGLNKGDIQEGREQVGPTYASVLSSSSCAGPDFRLLQQQLERMERQIRYLLDVRDESGRSQRYGYY